MAPAVQAWMPALGGNEVEGAPARSEQEAERHEGVGDVQDQHQAVARGAVAGPARQAHDVAAAAGDEQRSAGRRLQRQRPPSSASVAALTTIDDHVEAAERRRQPAGILARQPVAGEARDDAAADQHDQHDHDGDPGAGAVVGVPAHAPRRGRRCCRRRAATTSTTTLRLRQFLPAMISRAAAAATSSRNPTSIAAAAAQPIRPNGHRDAARSQASTRTSSGAPCSGKRPVQFGIAVSRKPAIDRRNVAVEHLVDVPVARREGGRSVARRRRPAATPAWRAPA